MIYRYGEISLLVKKLSGGNAMQSNQLKGNNGPRMKSELHNQSDYESIVVKKMTPVIGAEIF